ncbi:hypothetical protein ACR78G_20250 [Sphingobacterium spiritivorum]|uniref:hypothetical protein n=1 Tax=Sphingobacterium spiritivorum TaxID=258 RepID=UPI003DA63660
MNSTHINYPLEWLDSLVMQTLNPAFNDFSLFDYKQAEKICKLLADEESKLKVIIKKQAFGLDESGMQVMIEHYQSSLLMLLETSRRDLRHCRRSSVQLIYRALINCIDALLLHIETHYSKYMRLDLKAPPAYLSVARGELATKIIEIRKRADRDESLKELKELVFNSLSRFAIAQALHYDITFRSILYNKEMVRRLDKIRWKPFEDEIFNPLNELLWLMNFNSKSYINYLIKTVQKKVNSSSSQADQLIALHYYQKALMQMHKKPDVILNQDYYDLETVIRRLIKHEIHFKEEAIRFEGLENTTDNLSGNKEKTKVEYKIKVELSSDQIGLILRAADELRILSAKSMSEVFRTIVPYLSTPRNENLSYQGMRSKSYTAEETDKQKAIRSLERMISKINEY